MARFESGVKRYVASKVTLTVIFPVDFQDREDVCCYQCKFFSRNTGMCQLTKEISEFPQKYVGRCCPLERIED